MTEPDSTPASDVAIALVAQLESEADFVDAGSFTLDARKAREKLAAYQLAEPERFVLLLVEAAHLLPSCTGIAFTFDGDSTKAVFHGVELASLDNCFDAMFIDVASLDPEHAREVRGRQRLALALNTALGLSDSRVEMTSMSAGRGSVHAMFDRDGSVQTHDDPGTCLTSALVVNVHSKLLRDTQEQLLRSDARHASIPVHVNGTRIDVGPLADLLTPVEVRDAAGRDVGRLGWSAVQARRASGGIKFVANGVVVEFEHTQEELPAGSLALVDAGDLQRDISQAKLQRDEGFVQRVEAVVAACVALSQPVPTLGPKPTETQEAENGGMLLACSVVVIVFSLVGLWSDTLALNASIFLTGLAMCFVGIRGIRRARRRGRVREHGQPGLGTIKSSSSPGVGLPNMSPIWIDMRIERPGQDGYDVKFKTFVGSDVALVQPGKRTYIRIDPNDPKFVVFDVGA
jgi:hypothetical protein